MVWGCSILTYEVEKIKRVKEIDFREYFEVIRFGFITTLKAQTLIFKTIV